MTFSRNTGDDVGLGTVHRPVLMALEEEVTEDGMTSTSSVQSPLKAIASAVFSSSSSSTPHVNGKSTMTTTPQPVKKDIYRGDCQVDDTGRGGQSTADTV